MFNGFKLDTAKAKQADNTGSYIKEAGKYLGVIETAELGQFSSGSQYLDIGFKSEDNQTASLRLITQKTDGTENEYAMKKIHALMTCIKVRESSVAQATRKKYDYTTKQDTQQNVYYVPEFEGKKVGLLIEMEDYQNANGEWKQKPQLMATFNYENSMTAKEMLSGATKAEQATLLHEILMERDAKKTAKAGTPKPQTQGGYGDGIPQVIDQDDDLPF